MEKSRKDKLQEIIDKRNPAMMLSKLQADKTLAELVLKMDSITGPKGDDGYSPIKGKDYFTQNEINSFTSFIQSQVKVPKDGEPGKQGKPGETPIRGVDYWTPKDREIVINETLKNIKFPKDGKDGVSPNVEDIASLVISELDKKPASQKLVTKDELINFLKMGGFRGGGISSVAVDGVTITGDGTPGNPLVGIAVSDTFKVKYDAADPLGGYIADKFVAGAGITLSEGTGADENKLVITGTASYSLPIASASVLGGIKIGSRLSIDINGVLSADVQPGAGDVVGPATNTDGYIPQWNGANSKTLKDGLAVPAGGLAGITALNLKADALSGTINEIAYFNSATTITSLPVATYPSLTELSYVKGVTSGIQSQLNGKQASGSYEVTTNKATDFTTINNTLYPTVQAVNNAINTAVTGLLDYRGSYDASTNLFPATGGSGIAGAILKGDFWICSVAGTLGGTAVTAGDLIIALVDTPAQTASNWDLISHDINYVPENVANKVTSISGASTDTQYPSAKLTYDQLALKAAVGQTMYIGTTSHAINRASSAEVLTGITGLTPSANFVLTQNSVAAFTSEETGAIVNTLYLKAGNVGIGTTGPVAKLHLSGGDSTTSFTNATIALGYSNTGQYPNFIHTRSNSASSVGNAIDFYTSDGTAAGVFPTNAVLGMTITNGNVGIGTTGPNAGLEILKTTEQLRLSYNATHYSSFTVNSAGDLTLVGGTTAKLTATTFVGALTGTASGNLPLAGGTMTGKVTTAGHDEVGKTYTPASGAQTVALDCALNNVHVVSGNASGTAITFTIANATNSQPFIVSILQGGTTVSTIAGWFATVRWAGGSAPTLTATLNKRDTFGFIRTGADTYDGFVIGQNA